MPPSARHGVMRCKSSCHTPCKASGALSSQPPPPLHTGVWSFLLFSSLVFIWASVHVCALAFTVRPPAGAFSLACQTTCPSLELTGHVKTKPSFTDGKLVRLWDERWNGRQYENSLATISRELDATILTLHGRWRIIPSFFFVKKLNNKKPFGVEHHCLDGLQDKRGGERSCVSLPLPLFLSPPLDLVRLFVGGQCAVTDAS